MSKPELDIIRSPEAEMFLRSVTEGFYNRSYLGLWIFEVIGREWDEMALWSRDIRNEIYVQTCTWSIGIWEWVYGFEPGEGMTLEERRQRIMSKVRGVRPINPEVMRRGIATVSGADVGLKDFSRPYSFSVTLNVTKKPIPMERVQQFIYNTKPAHLAVSVEVIFPEIESTLRVGGAVGNSTIITIPRKPDTYDFRRTLYTAATAGAAASITVPQGADNYAFHSKLRTGGDTGAAASIAIPQRPDTYAFRSELHTGGNTGAEASIGVAEGTDRYDFRGTLRTGGGVEAVASINVPGKPDAYDFQSALHAGGRTAAQTALPIPGDTSSPLPATTILRTGGVCTIISNLPPKGE